MNGACSATPAGFGQSASRGACERVRTDVARLDSLGPFQRAFRRALNTLKAPTVSTKQVKTANETQIAERVRRLIGEGDRKGQPSWERNLLRRWWRRLERQRFSGANPLESRSYARKGSFRFVSTSDSEKASLRILRTPRRQYIAVMDRAALPG